MRTEPSLAFEKQQKEAFVSRASTARTAGLSALDAPASNALQPWHHSSMTKICNALETKRWNVMSCSKMDAPT